MAHWFIRHRKIPIALYPFRKEMTDDGFRGRTNDVGLFQLLAARDGDHRKFGREAFYVLGFFLQKALRDEQREVDILMAGGFEARVEFALQHFPNSIAVGLDDHAAFDDLGGLRHIALQYDILIPRGKVLASGCNR